MRTRVIVMLALVGSLAACGKKPPTPEELEKLVAAEKAAMAKLAPDAKVEGINLGFSISNKQVDRDPGAVELSLPDFFVKPKFYELGPKQAFTLEVHTTPGVTVEIGATKLTADAMGKISFPLDLRGMLQKVLATTTFSDHVFGVKTLEIPVNLSATDGGVRKGVLRVDNLFESWIAGLKDGPMLADGEVAGPSPRKSALVIIRGGSYASKFNLYGPATNFAEVDLVMFEASEIREKTCGPYVDSTGATKSVPLNVFDTVVRVVERKSGKEVAKRVFAASTACPKTIDGASTGESASVSDEVLIAWVKQILKK